MQQNFHLSRNKNQKPAKMVESDSDHFRRFYFRSREEQKQQKQFENEDLPGGIETISR